ncbi:MAG TPA: energy transducer TonB [Chitinophagaceae bacterium]|jgi:TonB family protein|nr:energy transducer TonB [Chitinophagaceae bacterium]
MKKNARPKIWVLAMAGSVFFITACNNGDYTRNASDTTAGNTDTATSNAPATDTSSASVSANESAASKNSANASKRKVSIGKMSESKTSAMKPDKDGIYEMTDVRPAYPGGQTALEDYINSHIEYQQPAIDNNTEGTVDVQFVVDENGSVSNAKVIGNQLGNGLDEEAVRVISGMPKWTPGKVKGKDVKTRMVLPITYKIEQ